MLPVAIATNFPAKNLRREDFNKRNVLMDKKLSQIQICQFRNL